MGLRRSAVAFGVACAALSTLVACPTVDLGASPPDIGLCNPTKGEPYFESDVWPNYLNLSPATKQCTASGCHDQNGQSALRFQTNPVDLPTNYKAAQVYLNCDTPESSELLIKPLAGVEPHGGGDIFASDSDPAVVTFLAWFQP
jgi:hypothetical protein